MFENAKLIWLKKPASPDEYAVFFTTPTLEKGRKYTVDLSTGSDYNLFVNGKLASFGQYPDYPAHRFYDTVDISEYIKDGENEIKFLVWYYGVDTQTYIKSDAYLVFEITSDGKTVAASGKNVLSAESAGYVPHLERRITTQLGLAWRYDANLEAGEPETSRELPTPECEWLPRPVKKTVMLDAVKGKEVLSCPFRSDAPLENGAAFMQNAVLGAEGNGYCYIFDFGRETVGFPEFEFEVPDVCEVLIGWGEHLDNGRCRTAVRNFSCGYRARPGKNEFLGSFRRFGCRYIQLFFIGSKPENLSCRLRPTVYPLERREHGLTGRRKEIFETSVRTLECCMHDHYEDCPWREQALYTLDSRNQMLCGYYAFGEYEFARANLKLMSYGLREDGFMPLCFPAGVDFPIPIYSLAYFIQMKEYTEYSKDTSLARELYGFLEKLADKFISRIGNDGLVGAFPGYWNFYEWSEGMAGKIKGDTNELPEAPLNAFLILALDAMADITEKLSYGSEKYRSAANRLRKSVADTFYNERTGLFRSYLDRDGEKYSVLTNSLCLLSGCAENLDKTAILGILSDNGAAEREYKVIPNTLSMNSFRFDALLAEDREKWAPVILDEIDRVYGKMLEKGATTFWETVKGADDFRGAGSLCHGWSALPVYYYSILT